jgi:hypothetical protein
MVCGLADQYLDCDDGGGHSPGGVGGLWPVGLLEMSSVKMLLIRMGLGKLAEKSWSLVAARDS